MNVLYKVLTPAEWNELNTSKVFKGNPHDIRDGYIHLCTEEQVRYVIDKYYKDNDEVLTIKIDRSQLESKLQWEDKHDTSFPHFYDVLKLEYLIT